MGALTSTLKCLLYETVLFSSALAAQFKSNSKLHTARFASLHEAASLTAQTPATKTSLLLGEGSLGHILRVKPTSTRRELGNVLAVAPTRGGKGLLAVSQLLTWPHSVVVNDIKGDLFTQTAGYRSELGPVFVIDPTAIGHRYDPLTGKHTEDELFSAATQLLFRPDEGEGAIFAQRGAVMLTQILLAAGMEGTHALPYVRKLVRQGFPSCARYLASLSTDLATQFLDLEYNELNLNDRFLLSAWGTLSTRMRSVLLENVVRCFAGSDFTAEEIMCSERPITVYLRWKEQDLLALAPLVRLIWGSLIDELITVYDKKQGASCNPVLLLVDEAGRTAIPSLSDHATTVVGRGISLWIAVQSLSQLDVVYGTKRAKVLRDNMESQIYYRPSNLETAQFIEHSLGRRSEYARSQTTREGAATSEGLSEQGVPLMTAGEIMQMRDEDIIVFHRRLPPMRAKRMDWRRYSLLANRRPLVTPILGPLPEPDIHLVKTTTRQDELVDPDDVG